MSTIAEITWPTLPFPIERHAVLVARRGSETHGTYRPPTEPDAIDDRDIYAVVVPPADYYLGLQRWEHAEAINAPWDVVVDELRKFVGLLCNQNPNVLSLLWLREEDYIEVRWLGRMLIQNRHLFRDREAAHRTFIGYAHGQLKKMTSFGQFKGYMGEKRKRLVERFGFDTKNASHLIRILRMGEEFLRTGELRVFRDRDADELVAIKRGEVPLVEIQRMAESLFLYCHRAYEASPLPERVDREAINALLTQELRRALAMT